MRHLPLVLVVAGAALALGLDQFVPSPRFSTAEAADFLYACPVVGADAGTNITQAINPGEQFMVRCEAFNGVRYRVCQSATCTATSTDSLFDGPDVSVDTCNPSGYVALGLYKLYDGGNPTCCIYKVMPSMPGVCSK